MKYRKKPVIIDALQWDGENLGQIKAFINGCGDNVLFSHVPLHNTIEIETLEGTMTAKVGDWIIIGISKECYPCKPDVFEKSYEKVN